MFHKKVRIVHLDFMVTLKVHLSALRNSHESVLYTLKRPFISYII